MTAHWVTEHCWFSLIVSSQPSLSFRKYLIGTCQALNGVPKFFDASKQQCTEGDVQSSQTLKQSTPSCTINSFRFWCFCTDLTIFCCAVIEKRVGESCLANKDCSDGMYCNSGVCACFLNYIEVNLKCIRGKNVNWVYTVCRIFKLVSFYSIVHLY